MMVHGLNGVILWEILLKNEKLIKNQIIYCILINECVLRMALANNGLDTYGLDDEC
jgi:hypothetical protein